MFSFHLIIFSFSQSLPDPLHSSTHPTLCSQSLPLKKGQNMPKQKKKCTKPSKLKNKSWSSYYVGQLLLVRGTCLGI